MRIGKGKKRENVIFIVLLVAVVIAGCLMLVWGQYNSARQVYDVGFVRYHVGDQLSRDEGYTKTEADAALYQAAKDAGAAWSGEQTGRTERYTTESATQAYPEAPAVEIGYTVYDQGGAVTVILLHAYNETTEDARKYAPYWWEKGCNVIVTELRGDSGSYEATTFGVWESYDLYDLFVREQLLDKQVVVHGEGVGAAAAILLAGRDNVAGIDLLVADTVYDNLKDLELQQLQRQFSLGDFLVGIFLDRIVRQQTGIEVDQVDLSDTAAGCTVPALFVVGGADAFIGVEGTQSVYAAWQGEKTWLLLDGVRHGMTWAATQESGAYAAALDAASAFLFA